MNLVVMGLGQHGQSVCQGNIHKGLFL